MIQNTHSSSKALIARLYRDYISRYKRRIILAIGCMILAGMATAANAYMMKPVLDDIFINRDHSKLYIIPAIIILIFAIGSGANYLHTLYMRYVGSKIIADMQMALFAHLLGSDLKLFHDQASGRLISRFTNDIQMMRNAVSTTLTAIAKEFITMLCLIGVMFYQSIELTLMAAIAFPLAIYPLIRFGKRTRKISAATQNELGEFTAQLDDIFQGVKTVKSYNRETFEVERANATITRLFELYFKASRIQAISSPVMELISGIVIASVVAYGGWQVIYQGMSPGAFFSFIAAFIMAYRPMKTLTGLNNVMQEGLAAANRLFDVLDTPPLIKDATTALALTYHQGDIRFDGVSFRYGENAGGVKNINIHIPPGKKVALVGESGGGKSTLMNLLMRFYDPEDGRIFIDGQDIKTVTQSSLRALLAYVPQEAMLFDDTIAANIGYGRLGATQAEIEEVAKLAAAHEFIAALPQGYQTMIGPHGVKLSGGQRQRIAIARAMLKNAPILLLDEATSALDNESERLVQQALNTLMQNRTTLMIAHRLTTIRHADQIYVLEAGRVVEHGSHAELVATKGAYFALEQAAKSDNL